MMEREKKKAQLSDDELDTVAGGRQYANPPGAYRTFTCPCCQKSYRVQVSALAYACCPYCGGSDSDNEE